MIDLGGAPRGNPSQRRLPTHARVHFSDESHAFASASRASRVIALDAALGPVVSETFPSPTTRWTTPRRATCRSRRTASTRWCVATAAPRVGIVSLATAPSSAWYALGSGDRSRSLGRRNARHRRRACAGWVGGRDGGTKDSSAGGAAGASGAAGAGGVAGAGAAAAGGRRRAAGAGGGGNDGRARRRSAAELRSVALADPRHLQRADVYDTVTIDGRSWAAFGVGKGGVALLYTNAYPERSPDDPVHRARRRLPHAPHRRAESAGKGRVSDARRRARHRAALARRRRAARRARSASYRWPPTCRRRSSVRTRHRSASRSRRRRARAASSPCATT